MLIDLHIRDFTIVDRLDLEFGPGMTALTGETGAGKSILLDALGLALGDRATADTVRQGAEKAEISVSFDLSDAAEVRRWLTAQDLDADDECLIRRVIQANGRSRGYINGSPVPLTLLRELGEQLVDIHGQHEHQSLMRRDIQRSVLDSFAGNGALLQQLGERCARARELEDARRALTGDDDDQEARKDLLRYQLQELEPLQLSPDAIAELDAEHRRLANAGSLTQTSQQLVSMLYEDDGSAQSQLGQAQRMLEEALALDPSLAEAHELITNALVQLEEGVDALRRHGEAVELDPARLEELERQIGTLSDLARKHRVRPEALHTVRDSLEEELDRLENAEERLQALDAELRTLRQEYDDLCRKLHERRQEAAGQLGRQVTDSLKHLGMAGASFRIAVTPQESTAFSPHGSDLISFEVRTNAGQAYGPLNRIASGGELSRISLAIQVGATDSTRIPTLVFDEADVGIGGGVAEVVGMQLRKLGASHQVLCVTHLPQVASQAHAHLQVSKTSKASSTATSVVELDREARVQEIARMLGGMKITQATLTHAEEMVTQAESG
ncbi:MAG: DNA repair protein RecN [Ectothiorhodospiraceae bacterium]|nr:DNA repair protein RecN [Ectothiorhodospiraceae bacterium]